MMKRNPRKPQKEMNLDQPRLFAVPETEAHKIIRPPAHVVVFDLHDGQFVIMAQKTTRIEGVPIRPAFIKHKRCRDPRWEARMMSRYFYEKSEAGTHRYRMDDGAILV